MQNNAVVGSNACRGNNVGSGVVAIGCRAGYQSTSSNGSIGDSVIMIGNDTCSMSTNSSAGAYSISLGTATKDAVPSNSVWTGRGAVPNGSDSGQIVIGNNSHHQTMPCIVSDIITMQTGTGGTLNQSLVLNPTNCTIAKPLVLTSGVIWIVMGSLSLASVPRNMYEVVQMRIQEAVLKHTEFIWA